MEITGISQAFEEQLAVIPPSDNAFILTITSGTVPGAFVGYLRLGSDTKSGGLLENFIEDDYLSMLSPSVFRRLPALPDGHNRVVRMRWAIPNLAWHIESFFLPDMESNQTLYAFDPARAAVRMSLTNGDIWALTDTPSSGTLYVNPVEHGRAGLVENGEVKIAKVNPIAKSLTGLAVNNYRVYVYADPDSGEVEDVDLVAWSSLTEPPAGTLSDAGFITLVSDVTRRAIGDLFVASTGLASWTTTVRGLSHLDRMYRRPSSVLALPGADSWLCLRNQAWRAIAGGSTAGQHFFYALVSDYAHFAGRGYAEVIRQNGSNTYKYQIGVGIGGVGVNHALHSIGHDQLGLNSGDVGYAFCHADSMLSVGLNQIWLTERNLSTSRDVTVYGDNGGTTYQAGFSGQVTI